MELLPLRSAHQTDGSPLPRRPCSPLENKLYCRETDTNEQILLPLWCKSWWEATELANNKHIHENKRRQKDLTASTGRILINETNWHFTILFRYRGIFFSSTQTPMIGIKWNMVGSIFMLRSSVNCWYFVLHHFLLELWRQNRCLMMYLLHSENSCLNAGLKQMYFYLFGHILLIHSIYSVYIHIYI